MQGSPAGTLGKTTAVKDRVYCQKCGSGRVYRVEREGFMQERIYPLFGYYPWRCELCGVYMMLKKRNRARTRTIKHIE
jgi:DNA-directed RNA polymerase subunit RPC12/RpoP